jgi:hypothetical protein
MNITPEFFDLFGLPVFLIILGLGILLKYQGKRLSRKILKWISVTLIIIGILGLIVDGSIIVIKFILGL